MRKPTKGAVTLLEAASSTFHTKMSFLFFGEAPKTNASPDGVKASPMVNIAKASGP
jgi:hypothetical protein